MVMQINKEQLAKALNDEKTGLLVSTNSRNRKVEIHYKKNEFLIYDAGKLVGETDDLEHAVDVFNYYGARDLSKKS